MFTAPINKSPMILLACKQSVRFRQQTGNFKNFYFFAVLLPDCVLRRLESLVFQNEAFRFFTKIVAHLVEERSKSIEVQ